jgi:hypothetical protein
MTVPNGTGQSATSRLYLTPSGNLGLGVTPSAWLSSLNAQQIGSTLSLWGANSGGNNAGVDSNSYINSAGNSIYIASNYATRYQQYVGQHIWYTAPSGTAGNAITFTQAMTLDASGNLLVGTTSSTYKVDVTVSGNNGIRLQDGTNQIYLGWSGGEATTGTLTNAPYSFFTNGSERARITSGGDLLVGTTTTPSSANAQIVAGGAANSGVQFASTNNGGGLVLADGSGSGGLIFYSYTGAVGSESYSERARIASGGDLLVGTTNTSATTGAGFKFAPGTNPRLSIVTGSSTADTSISLYSTGAGAYRFFVDPSGTIYATVTTISSISDERYKENIRDLDVGLDAVMALKPRKFDWKEGKGADTKDARGFIAQEFEQVFPDLVDEWRDPAPEGEEPYKSVRQDLIPVLVKAIQELSAKNDALEARIAALEAK